MEERKKDLEFQLDCGIRIKGRPCTCRNSTGKLPNTGEPPARTSIGPWGRWGSVPLQAPPCMRWDGDARLDLPAPARLRHSPPEPHHPFPSSAPARQTPPLPAELCGTPVSATSPLFPPAQDIGSHSRARTIRRHLQEKPLLESWREISKRVLLVRATIRFLARKVRFDVWAQAK